MLFDKRSARRIPGRIGIYTRDQDGLNFGFITDLSRKGAFIETQRLIPTGAPFEFTMSNGKQDARFIGRVARTRDAFFEGGTSGLGIEFSDLSGLSRRVRDDLILYLLNLQYQQKWEHEQNSEKHPR